MSEKLIPSQMIHLPVIKISISSYHIKITEMIMIDQQLMMMMMMMMMMMTVMLTTTMMTMMTVIIKR